MTDELTDCPHCGEPAAVEPPVEVPAQRMNGRIITPAHKRSCCLACSEVIYFDI